MDRHVLIVDDSITMRDMLMYTLSNAGFTVFNAGDGIDALDVLEDNSVNLVITDINMPRMDGIELIRQIRKTQNHAFVPILCLTTETSEDMKADARSAGATGWIKKPFDPDKLIKTATKVCM